ncbi:MAG: pyruvate kinase, partial [Chloroflexota bacterium]|nr:pyruvate kinase [Chloroflexota bacterium]
MSDKYEKSKFNRLGEKEIICTLGPSSLNDEIIVRLEELGVSLFRINLSHTRVSDLVDTIHYIQGVTSVPICLDTEGAQIRTGELLKGDILLENDDVIRIPYDRIVGDDSQLNLYPEWVISNIEVGDLIQVDSEEVIWQVISRNKNYISVRVLVGGLIGQNKAVTVDRDIVMPAMTDKDRECLQIGFDLGVRHFAISFVHRSADVDSVREIVGQESQITSKIECIKGVINFDSIAAISDSLLIDRGDLSRQVLIEKIPQLQKNLIQRAIHLDTKIYVATNLLESMVNTPVPTRAEINDIHNTLRDGASGLVLAAETAIGSYPKRCVEMVSRVIQQYLNDAIDWPLDSYLRSQASTMLIEPHGGKLVDRVNDSLDITGMITNTIEIDYSVMSNIEQIAIGTFSPIEGFMNREEIDLVLEQYRMPSGVIWPLPIIFQVSSQDLQGVRIGDVIGLSLRQSDDVCAILYLEDIFTYDLDELALKTFGTNDYAH